MDELVRSRVFLAFEEVLLPGLLLQLREELHVPIEEHFSHRKEYLRSSLKVRCVLIKLLHRFGQFPHSFSPSLVLMIGWIKSMLHQHPNQALFGQQLLNHHLDPLHFVRLQSF